MMLDAVFYNAIMNLNSRLLAVEVETQKLKQKVKELEEEQ